MHLIYRSFSTTLIAKKPFGFWNDIEKQRQFLDELAKKLNIKQLDDWYTIPFEEIKARNAQSFFDHYGGSLARALSTIYSDYPWEIWRFKTVPDGFWTDLRNQRQFFDWLGKKLEYKDWTDWYKIKVSDVKNHGGSSIASYYDHSLFKAFISIYPEYNWDIRKFVNLKTKWKEGNINTHRDLFDFVYKEMGLKSWKDWYHVQLSELGKMGVDHLIREYYGSSLKNALITIYPEYPWRMWRFGQVPENFWRNSENQRNFFDSFASENNLRSNEDWYKITKQDLSGAGGRSLLNLFKDSISTALEVIYPERNFVPWQFKEGVPPGFWDEENNIKRAINWVEKQCNIQRIEDWYMVSELRLSNLGLLGLLKKFGGVVNFLRFIHPEFNWDSKRMVWKNQHTLFSILQELYPEMDILAEHVMQPFVYSDTKRNMTVDVFIPALNLAFEYQGEQHFRPSEMTVQYDRIQFKDEEKRKAFKEHGITLIEVPYWWDQSKDTLQKMIQQALNPNLQLKMK